MLSHGILELSYGVISYGMEFSYRGICCMELSYGVISYGILVQLNLLYGILVQRNITVAFDILKDREKDRKKRKWSVS
jgi:hypothetical protein